MAWVVRIVVPFWLAKPSDLRVKKLCGRKLTYWIDRPEMLA